MAKELPFFKFEVSEWMFGRIQKQPLEVQGTFINLCCKYWHKLGELSHDDAELDFNKDHIKSLIDCRVIAVDDGYIVVKFLDIQLDERKEVSRISSLKGKKSAELRLNRKQLRSTAVQPISTGVEPQSTSVQPNPTEEKRREDILYVMAGLFGKEYKQPLDRMHTEAGFYKDIDLAYDQLLPVLKTPDEIGRQIKGYQKYCRDMKQKPINHAYKLTETIIRSDWVVLSGSDQSHLKSPLNGFSEAEYNRSLWTLEAWEKTYADQITNDSKFRKHFKYD